jgi:hypothetical protein
MRSPTILCLVALAAFDFAAGCRRAQFTLVDDAGPMCATNPAGLVWRPGISAAVAPPQTAAWTAQSNDSECAALKPSAVPPRLSLTTPGGSYCDPGPSVDGQGNLAVRGSSSNPPVTFFIRADGSAGTAISDIPYPDTAEYHGWLVPRANGFWLSSRGARTDCYFLRQLAADGMPGETISTGVGLAFNPMGGFVESRGTINYHSSPPTMSEEVRWVTDALQPLGDWHVVFTWTIDPDPNLQLAIVVDQQGRALMLSFAYPKSFGPPAPPSAWKFEARWMGPGGPLGETFEPVAPQYIINGQIISFAGWGTLLPLPGGGIAAFHDADGTLGGGRASPSGWYVAYPGPAFQTAAPPGWLQTYDGSISMIGRGAAYAATQRGSNSCARTVLLVAPSGRTCFTLPLLESESCDWDDSIRPDGTLVMRAPHGCELRWWPGLVR